MGAEEPGPAGDDCRRHQSAMVPTGPAGTRNPYGAFTGAAWREQSVNDDCLDNLVIPPIQRLLDEPSLDIVIVAYRSRDLLRDCLTSIRRHPADVPTTIYVIDNDSRDGTVELVRRDFPEVVLEAAGANLGFSKANNV